jgi:hypothetical protein
MRILQAAKDVDQCDCARIAIGMIGDLTNHCESCLDSFLQVLVPCLNDCLNYPNSNNEIKIVSIVALGDLCLASGDKFC